MHSKKQVFLNDSSFQSGTHRENVFSLAQVCAKVYETIGKLRKLTLGQGLRRWKKEGRKDPTSELAKRLAAAVQVQTQAARRVNILVSSHTITFYSLTRGTVHHVRFCRELPFHTKPFLFFYANCSEVPNQEVMAFKSSPLHVSISLLSRGICLCFWVDLKQTKFQAPKSQRPAQQRPTPSRQRCQWLI